MLADLVDSWTDDPLKRKWLLSYIPVLLSVSIICIIAWQLANLFWALQTPAPTPTFKMNTTSNQATTQTSVKNYDLAAIKRANLFGQYVAEDQAPVIEDTVDAPETTLQLNLHGTLLSDDQSQSRAVIEVNGKDTVFSIGDEIQNDVSLHSVLAYQVILNNRGRKEVLKLPREDADTASGSARPTQTRSSASNRIAKNIRANALSNPSSITDILRLKKGQTSTGQKGFRVYPGKKRDRFRELGLKPGDFVTQVNGMPVAEQNPFQVIQTLSTTSYINFSIERNGQPMNLSFDLSQTQ